MLKLFVFLLLAPNVGSQPELHQKFRERVMDPTPVTDKDLRPVKLRDCRTEAEVQRTLQLLSYGEKGECFIRDRRAFSRR